MTEKISGGAFKQMVAFGAACITAQKQAINDLNVFPVPDGDTGTNMSLTIQTAVNELRKAEPATVDEAAKLTASGLLRGARGNSGVILSLLFRGMSKVLKGHDTADGVLLAEAMQEGVSTAYGAVMKPAEGTVLTVSRLAAQRALEAAGEKNDAEFVLDEAIKTGYTTLAETIEMNPVLKKAGVVDAGGKGYLIILEGMLRALRGEPVPEVVDTAEEKADFAAIGDEDITFAFDTVFIVRKTSDKPLDGLRAYLNSIGDSLVIGEDDEAFKVHVHTDTPGDALNEAQKYGTLELAKIENMRTQAADLAAGKKAQSTDDLDAVEAELERGETAVAAPEKRYGFLAVCAGEGLEAVFRDLTVDRIVSGGQTMNPSTEAILQEVNRTPSEIVFILPNNKNIIMAAQQCVGLTEKQVIVVPTATVPQGISAMMAVDPDNDDPQAILAAMTEAAANVTTAQITYAARNSDFDGFAINEGDYLALCDGKLLGTDRSLDVLLDKLAHVAADKNAEFVTVYSGQGVTEDDAARAAEVFETICPDAEVAGPFVARSVGSGAVVHRRECELIQVVGQAAVGTDIADRLAGSHREAEQPVLSEADRPGQRGDFAVIQYDERHAGELFGDFKEDRPDSGCEFRFRNAAEQRRDARLVVHIDARGAAADRVDAGELGGGPLQRIDDPGAVVIDVLLEIRVPDDLLAVDGFPVFDRRAFAVGAAEVEADPAAVEVAAEFDADLPGGGGRLERAVLDRELPVVDPPAHHVVIEGAFAAGGVGAPERVTDPGAAADGEFPAAPRPEQEFDDPLDVAEVEFEVLFRIRLNHRVEAGTGAVGALQHEREFDRCAGRRRQTAEFAVPQRGGHEARIEFRQVPGRNRKVLHDVTPPLSGTAPIPAHWRRPSCSTPSG